jgi:two-component system NarL family response regulator
MKVLLVDDHRLLLEGLANLLAVHQIEVAGMAYDGFQAIEMARRLNPDVILMDIRMPGCDGLNATRQITAENPGVKIVMLTTYADDQDLFEAIKSGARGYLLKSMDAGELIECLELVQQDIPPFSPGLANRILAEFSKPGAPAPGPEQAPERSPNLTARQLEVLALVSQGYTYKETGLKLGLSPRTIKYHMAEIMQQLHLKHRAQVLAAAGRLGLDANPAGE